MIFQAFRNQSKVSVEGLEEAAEESMVNYIKAFGECGDVRSFVESQLHLPPSMQDRFAAFRRVLSARAKQFTDLADLKAQLSYFRDVFNEVKTFPASWVIYGSNVSCLFMKSGGRFVENSGTVFATQAKLGHFCSSRAKYTVMGLKDLLLLRQLKCSQDVSKSLLELASALDTIDAANDAADGPGDELTACLAAFDGDTWLRKRLAGVCVCAFSYVVIHSIVYIYISIFAQVP